MLESLFQNVKELDMFGTLFVSGASGIDIKRFRKGKRPRIEKYNPDAMDPGALKPFLVSPHNSGKLPADVAQIALEQMKELAGQGSYYGGETSGRIDSAAGLGFLFNTGNIALGLPTNGLADALAGVYSRMLQVAKSRYEAEGAEPFIEIATVDDAIAGVVLDPGSGRMELGADNTIPNPWEVRIDIHDRVPRDKETRKVELKELYQLQLVSPTRFWVSAMEEDLDMPGADKELWATWQKVTWQIIVLFRDGQEPGKIDLGEHTQNPQVQLIALQQFMNKIQYSLSSDAVRQKFEEWKMYLESLLGVYPVGIGPPEEVAAAQTQAAGPMAL